MKLNPRDYNGTYKVIGGQLCFDFTNTISWRDTGKPHDWLDGLDNLSIWVQLVGLYDKDQAKRLIVELDGQALNDGQIIGELVSLRELINKIFVSIIDTGNLPEHGMELLNLQIMGAMGQIWMIQDKDGHRLGFPDSIGLYPKLKNEIILSTVRALTDIRKDRIKICYSCHWLFEDTTRNNSRRWCVMEDCGNRYKVNKFNKKEKKSKP